MKKCLWMMILICRQSCWVRESMRRVFFPISRTGLEKASLPSHVLRGYP
jgi:hypothetical protein